MNGRVTRADVARIRDEFRRSQARNLAQREELLGQDRGGAAVSHGLAGAYGFCADDLDRLLGEDTGSGVEHERESGGAA